MKFKIDENLPVETAQLFRTSGFSAETVEEEELRGTSDARLLEVCLREDRILITLDLDFADVRLSSWNSSRNRGVARRFPRQTIFAIYAQPIDLRPRAEIARTITLDR